MIKRIKGKWNNVPITVKVSIAYAICSILQRCLSFITLPLFARLLTTEQYGQYTIYQSWSGILAIFITLNLAYGSFSTAMIKYEDDRNGYISSVEGICIMLSIVFMIAYLPFKELWNKLFELPTVFICIMVAELLGTTAIQLWTGKKRFEYRYKSVVCITLLMSFVSPILAYLFVVNSNEKGYARIIGYAIVNISVGLFFYFANAIYGKKLLCKEYWKYALSFNIPLLVYYLSQVVFNQSDRIMISHMVGKDKAAIYGVAYSLAMMLTFVLNAINNSYVPWYYGKIKENKQEENKEISIIIAGIIAILLTGVIWSAPEIILVFAGEKYYEAIYVVPPVAISLLLLFYSQLFINVEFYYEEKTKLIWASISAAVTNLIMNWFCIRRFGFVAAAYTTLLSYIIFALANYFAMKKVLKEKGVMDNAYNYKGLVLLLIIFSFLSIIGMLCYPFFGIRLVMIVLLLSLIVWKRRVLIEYYKRLKKKDMVEQD